MKNCSLIRDNQSFRNYSVGLQMDPRNVWSTKWSVHKAIWQSEQFPECNMTSARGSLTEDLFGLNEFPNQALKKIHCALDKISLIFETVFWWEIVTLGPTFQLDFSWTLEMPDRENGRFIHPNDSQRSFLSTTAKDFLRENFFKMNKFPN